ncbi:helix-turn-helix domain-containing protein [Mycoplasmopsis alligatoris]|uniref:Chromosomal replication initiator protein DnaA n=1 Tax=Mycoplasmopsis alligatoris A21JP2 TaxID=747682 RepID=D4XWH5_9BACT|nr:DnaA/Hda family protein [Mycoplasmopsis alligatoris]EFF41126.1 putative chromosomal replication initiator protein DnaA [Mycoplasmopsis alligatoris A21JP2]
MKNNKEASIFTYTSLFRENIKLDINDQMLFTNFFKDLKVVNFNSEMITFYLNLSDNILDKTRSFFDDNISKAIKEIFGKPLVYKLVNKLEDSPENLKSTNENQTQGIEKPLSTPTKRKNSFSSFDKNYSFKTYVQSDFNKETINACKLLINNEFKMTPIYIQASSGFGKTHLLNAIGNEFIKNGKTAFYINPSVFSRDIATYLQENNQNKISKLLNYYCEVDLLMFDDIQVFGNGQKKATIQFIFQIIDHRIQKEKPTLFASEGPIQSLKSLFDNRIITRLSSGFITQIKPPNKDDFYKLLNFFLEKEDPLLKNISKESKNFIIRNYCSNVRNISAAVKRIGYYKKDIIDSNYSDVVVENSFKDLVKDKESITPDLIIETVSKYYKIPKKEIIGASRKKEIVVARHMAMIIIRNHLELSLEEIGKIFNKDHSTIINAIKKYDEPENNKSFKNALSFLNEEIFKLN